MAHKREIEFPTEWVMYDADDNKRGYDKKHSEDRVKDSTEYREGPPAAHQDTVRTKGACAATDLKVKSAAA